MSKRLYIFASVVAGLTLHSNAQNYSIDWFTIDGGGGSSTGGVYSVSGTIGQPDVGTLTGGPYTVTGGFWGIVGAIQTPGAPRLIIDRETTFGQVRVSWPRPAPDFLLQETTSLLNAAPSPWTLVPFPYQTNATEIFIVVPPPTDGSKYYRLVR